MNGYDNMETRKGKTVSETFFRYSKIIMRKIVIKKTLKIFL